MPKVTQGVRARGKAAAWNLFSGGSLQSPSQDGRVAGVWEWAWGYHTQSKHPARTYPRKRLSFPYRGGLARARGALSRWDGTPDVTGTETAAISISHRRTGSGCLTSLARATPIALCAAVRGSLLWVGGNSPPPGWTGLRGLLTPRGITRPGILATLPNLTPPNGGLERPHGQARLPRLGPASRSS